MLLSNAAIGKKLGVGFGILILMLLGIILFDNSTTTFTQKSYQKLINNDLAITGQVSKIHISLLELRRREKDFLLRNDMVYVDKHEADAQKLYSAIDTLYNLAWQADRPEVINSVELLRRNADGYLDNFKRLVTSKKVMGLDQNSGLQGRFHKQALLLAQVLDGHNIADLFQEYLLMRRWEKDFVRTKNEKYKQRLLNTIVNYQNLLSVSPAQEQAKKAQQQALAQYELTFKSFLANKGNTAVQEYENMRKLAHEMEQAINQVFIPNAEALILEIRNSEKDFLLHKNPDYIVKTHDAIVLLKQRIADSNVKSQHETKLIQYLNSYETAFSSLVEEEKRSLGYIANLRSAAHKMEPALVAIEEATLKTAEITLTDTLLKTKEGQWYSLLAGGLIIVLGLFTALFVIRSIRTPVIEMMKVVDKIAKGDLNQKLPTQRTDELGKLAIAVNSMIDSLNDAADQADAIAEGDFNVEIIKKSDQDRLVIALNEMKNQILERNNTMAQSEALLQKSNQDLKQQSLLKSQISSITELSQGATELQLLADNIISKLAEMINAGHGVFYVSSGDDSDHYLELIGSFAFEKRKTVQEKIAIGEGLVGQCAKEKKSILLTHAPSDYIHINSGLGGCEPLNILVIPMLFEQKVVGVIELASFQLFTSLNQTMLEQVANNTAVVINNIFSQQKTKQLLGETQSQSEELQVQQEELKSSNDDLLEQTKLLKVSEEELKQQSEELRVSNEELLNKQVMLKRQKEAVEASQKDLSIKAKELALASKYKSEFLANMSHELRTPLNSLLLLAKSLAENNKNHLDETEVEDANIIHRGGINLLSLINDILDLSKVEAGKLTIHNEKLSINTLVANLKVMFLPIANDRSLKFNIKIADNIPEIFHSDGQRLEQILRNLLSNAFKFTQSGSVTFSISKPLKDIKFKVDNLQLDSCLAFSIIDTGIGIPEDKVKDIFEAFQQQDGSITRKYGGTGLGLTIARELTQLLKGEIQLTSIEDEGSCFTLFMPLRADDIVTDVQSEPEESIKNNEVVTEKAPLIIQQYESEDDLPHFVSDDRKNIHEHDKCLLVIDDDADFAKILRDLANKEGFKCLVAGDGRSGIYLAQHFKPHGILLDMSLPDIDGEQVLEQLKFSNKTRHIPVEIISAHHDIEQQILKQGAIGLLTKPVNEIQIKQIFKNISEINKAKIKNILIIEAAQESYLAANTLLSNNDIKISCINTGKEGCEAIISGGYDCIILDLGLPDMNGLEVLKCASEVKDIKIPPIIVYTDKDISNDEEAQLLKYSASVVIKGDGSAERLLDDVSLFLHNIDSTLQQDDNNIIQRLHNENEMLKDRRILLVDDDMRNTYALSKKLYDLGFDVEMANNGQEALDLLVQEQPFELILMDTMMPVMDGFTATQKIREMKCYKKVPIIALTAKTMPEDREKCLQSGASEYLSKPIDFEKLISIMRIWLFKPHS